MKDIVYLTLERRLKSTVVDLWTIFFTLDSSLISGQFSQFLDNFSNLLTIFLRKKNP